MKSAITNNNDIDLQEKFDSCKLQKTPMQFALYDKTIYFLWLKVDTRLPLILRLILNRLSSYPIMLWFFFFRRIRSKLGKLWVVNLNNF